MRSSTSVFHSPHPGHCPTHRGDSCPHAEQTWIDLNGAISDRGYVTVPTAPPISDPVAAGESTDARTSLIAALVGSRVLVLAAAIGGALIGQREQFWWLFDPTRISASLGSVGNTLAAGSVRWDSIHYLDIAHHGYANAGDTVFFPVYPIAMAALGFVVRSDVVAGILISLASFTLAFWLLHRLTELELGRPAADATVLLLAFAPMSFFFTAVYTESLFLALSIGALYAARNECWAIAGALAAVASVTRIPGILLIIPITLMFYRRYGRLGPRLGWLLPAPAALLAFLLYLKNRGYPFLSPIKQQTNAVHAHTLSGPIHTLGLAIGAAGHGINELLHGMPVFMPSVYGPFPYPFKNLELLGFLLVAVFALVLSFRRLPLAYSAYAGLLVIVCIWSPIPAVPLQGFDRYTLAMFPLWMAAGMWLSEHRAVLVALMLSMPMLVFFTYEFATWTFIA